MPRALKTTGMIADWLRTGRLESLDLSEGALFSWLDSLRTAILRTPTWLSRTRLEMKLPEAADDEATAWLAAADLLRTWPRKLADFVDELQTNTRHRGPTTRMGRSLGMLLRQACRLEELGYPAPANDLREHLLTRYTRGHVTRKGILFRNARHRRQLARSSLDHADGSGPTTRFAAPFGGGAGASRRSCRAGSSSQGRAVAPMASFLASRSRRMRTAYAMPGRSEQTAERLGIDAPRVVELVRANVLRDAVRRPVGWLIPVDVVTDLLDRIQRLTVVPQDLQNVVSFRDALRRFGIRGLSVVTIADRLLRNELAAFRDPQCTGLAGLVFDEADIQRLSRELQTERPQITGYSLSDVASALVPDHRMGSRCLRKWIAAGLLRAQRRRKAWWIAPDEVRRFRTTYCLAREACSTARRRSFDPRSLGGREATRPDLRTSHSSGCRRLGLSAGRRRTSRHGAGRVACVRLLFLFPWSPHGTLDCDCALDFALTVTLLALVRQVRLARALRRLVMRLFTLWKNRHA